MTGTDAYFVRLDRDTAYNHTLKVMILDPSTDPDGWSFDRYRALLENYLSVATTLTMLRRRYVSTPLGIHQPVWVDDPLFEVDAHLRRVVCPAPGGMTELCRLVEEIYCHPLDHSRPLWEVWVVEGLEDGRVALVTLLHHSYADGAGVRGILEEVAAATPTDTPDGDGADWDPQPLPSAARRLAWAVRDLPALARAVPTVAAAMRERRALERAFPAEGERKLPSAADRRAQQPFGGLLRRSRRLACDSFTIDEMQEIRRAFGGSLNDVFMSCVAGSMREFLLKRGSPCDSPTVGTMAFLAKPLEERSAPGGNFDVADYTWLRVDLADPIRRLAATRESANATKDHFRRVSVTDPLLVLSDLIPGGLMRALGRFDERTEGRFTPGCNAIISNVVGPREPRYLGRWLIDRWFSIGQVLHGATLNITGWSYAGQFSVCVLAGSARVDDAWELMNAFRAALEELLELARAQTSGQRDAVSMKPTT